jgi:hypothetical protein
MIHDLRSNRMYKTMVQSTTRHFLSDGELQTETFFVHHPNCSSVFQSFIYTDMRPLTTGIRSEKCVVRRFRRCTKVY